ncbi:MAG: outer membrane lipoprotein chaperone LolA [Candidatus Binatia bacterium]
MRRGLPVAVAAVWLAAAGPFLGAASEPGPSASPKVGEVVRKLQARYDATKDFTADFTQTVEAATLGKPLQSTGQLLFKRPGRMRWEFVEPEKQTIVADGKLLWVYQPEHHQVLKTPFRAAFQSATPISFLFGVGQLKDDFDATLVSSGSPDVIRLRLVPKREHEIGVLVLDVGLQTYDIAAAEVTDPLGNVTRLAFSNLKRDVGLEDSQFTFDIPPGADVVEPPGNS